MFTFYGSKDWSRIDLYQNWPGWCVCFLVYVCMWVVAYARQKPFCKRFLANGWISIEKTEIDVYSCKLKLISFYRQSYQWFLMNLYKSKNYKFSYFLIVVARRVADIILEKYENASPTSSNSYSIFSIFRLNFSSIFSRKQLNWYYWFKLYSVCLM